MSDRFSLFSHLENLDTGSLILSNPFQTARDAGVVCRYDLRWQDSVLMQGDGLYQGMARWHRLLPVMKADVAALNFPVANFCPIEKVAGPESVSVIEVETHPLLPFALSVLHLKQCDSSGIFAVGADLGIRSLLPLVERIQDKTLWLPQEWAVPGQEHGYQGSIAAATELARRLGPHHADLGTWGNPFRLEAWKCLGLEIIAKHPDEMPILIVMDPSGECLAALVLACHHCFALGAKTPPFRIVAVQSRPFHQLAQCFEGSSPCWQNLELASNQRCLKPPESMLRFIVEGIIQSLGTAIVLNREDDGPLLEAALKRLLLTGFIDKEDIIYSLRA